METLNGSWEWKKYRFHWLGGKNWEARYRITVTTRSCSRSCYIRRPFKALKSPMQSRMGITAVTFLVGIIPIYVRLEIVPSFFFFLKRNSVAQPICLSSRFLNNESSPRSCLLRSSILRLIFVFNFFIIYTNWDKWIFFRERGDMGEISRRARDEERFLESVPLPFQNFPLESSTSAKNLFRRLLRFSWSTLDCPPG